MQKGNKSDNFVKSTWIWRGVKESWDFEPTPLSENLKGVLCPQIVMFAPCYYSSCPGLLIGLTSLGPKSGQSDDFVNLLIS